MSKDTSRTSQRISYQKNIFAAVAAPFKKLQLSLAYLQHLAWRKPRCAGISRRASSLLPLPIAG
jgi:hypothetical protein